MRVIPLARAVPVSPETVGWLPELGSKRCAAGLLRAATPDVPPWPDPAGPCGVGGAAGDFLSGGQMEGTGVPLLIVRVRDESRLFGFHWKSLRSYRFNIELRLAVGAGAVEVEILGAFLAGDAHHIAGLHRAT